jgi:tetratricopeptide (TPR) repeat protein
MLEKQEKELELKTVLEQAELSAEKNEYEKANDLYNKALEIYNEANSDDSGKANLLFTIGLNLANYGNTEEALQKWEQSANLFEQLGDSNSKAFTLYEMGNTLARTGNVPAASDYWKQALELQEKTGDTIAMAATLINLAWSASRSGDNSEVYKLNFRAAQLLAQNKIWAELLKVLINLAKASEAHSASFLAQALWLAEYLETDADTIFFATSDLLKIIGLENEQAPVITSACLLLTSLRSTEHPKKKEIQQACTEMLAACVLVRNVPKEEISGWLKDQGLNDSETIYPEFERALNNIVGENNWLFDRTDFSRD